jgi:polyisoprenoid-binding protein YceI
MLVRTPIAAGWLAASLAVVAAVVAAAVAPAEVMTIKGASRVVIHVGKAGAFGFAGHIHEVEAPVTGTIDVDRSDPSRSVVVLEFDAASMRVSGAGEPAQDVPEVQRVMLSDQVLDVKRYPKIVFRSRRVTGGSPSAGSFSVEVAGDLSLHGVTRPVVVPVRVTLGDGGLEARGAATLRQTDFGIHPVTAAGGAIKVKDELDLTFDITAGK